jgi:sulfatase maturation enzyme AslB (radical SAM superfamily)
MTDNKPFCSAPWTTIQHGSVLQQGGTCPCCEWSSSPIFKGGIKKYLESEWLHSVKETMQSHDMDVINSTCKSCLDLEKLNIKSKRNLVDDWLESGDLEFGKIGLIDYRASNLCNLKCRMCFPSNSSLIAKEMNIDIDDSKNFIDDIYEYDLKDVGIVNIVGGEPSIDHKVHGFLDWLILNNWNEHVQLTITTNATNTNKNWIDRISKFKTLTVIISVDGIDGIYEYIRTNANWYTVSKNISVYESMTNINVYFQITGSMHNIPAIEKWLPWFLDKEHANIFPVESQPHLSLDALPDDIKQEKINYLKTIDSHMATAAIQMLEASTYNSAVHRAFIDDTNRLDKMRKTDITAIDPVFKRIIKGIQ